MMKAKEIAAALEDFAPLGTQEPWDNAGICIGSPEAEVSRVLVGFDCTPELLREAVRIGAEMVVTHHPLIFDGLKRIDPREPVGEAVTLAVKNDIVVYAAHTNADKAEGGVNALMASRLGMVDPRPLDETHLAFIGRLGNPMGGKEFCSMLKERFSLKVLRCSRPVERVCCVATSCGSGSSFADAAFRAGADAFVTADVSYHHFFVPEGHMIADIGHWESEREIVSQFVSVLQKKLTTFAVCTTTQENNNPIHYL